MRLQRWMVNETDDHVTMPLEPGDSRGEWVKSEDVEKLEVLATLVESLSDDERALLEEMIGTWDEEVGS